LQAFQHYLSIFARNGHQHQASYPVDQLHSGLDHEGGRFALFVLFNPARQQDLLMVLPRMIDTVGDCRNEFLQGRLLSNRYDFALVFPVQAEDTDGPSLADYRQKAGCRYGETAVHFPVQCKRIDDGVTDVSGGLCDESTGDQGIRGN
jgi:hypothetical protein